MNYFQWVINYTVWLDKQMYVDIICMATEGHEHFIVPVELPDFKTPNLQTGIYEIDTIQSSARYFIKYLRCILGSG